MLGRATAAALAFLAGAAQAIVVSSPTATSVWRCAVSFALTHTPLILTRPSARSQSADGDARIEWSLLPATSPPPATQVRPLSLISALLCR